MPSRIFGVEENLVLLSLVESFREPFTKLADVVNQLCSADDEVCVRIEDGWRDSKRQLANYSKGRKLIQGEWHITDGAAVVTDAKPGQSAHEYGEACHLVLHFLDDGRWLRGMEHGLKPDPRWERYLGIEAERLGLVWGGRFKVRRSGLMVPFFDAAHVESKDWRDRASMLGWRGLQRT